MTRIATFLALFIIWMGVLPSAWAQTNASTTSTYDIVLAHGRVIDPETKLDAVRNVGIKNGKTAAVSQATLEGQVVVDSTGLIVAPGFIDWHAHGQSTLAVRHSSGGHLALWLAARKRIAPTNPIYSVAAIPLQGAIAIAGAVDLRRLQALRFRDGFVNRFVVEDLLGGTPAEVPDRYDAASPMDLLPLSLPQVLLHGTADDIAPIEISEAYVRQAQALGDDATLVRIQGADHFDAIDPNTSAFGHLRDAVLNLVHQTVAKT